MTLMVEELVWKNLYVFAVPAVYPTCRYFLRDFIVSPCFVKEHFGRNGNVARGVLMQSGNRIFEFVLAGLFQFHSFFKRSNVSSVQSFKRSFVVLKERGPCAVKTRLALSMRAFCALTLFKQGTWLYLSSSPFFVCCMSPVITQRALGVGFRGS